MASKTCSGCNATFTVNDKAGRSNFSHHLNNCEDYKQRRSALFAQQDKESDDQKRVRFLSLLDEAFTIDQKESILEAIKYWTEG